MSAPYQQDEYLLSASSRGHQWTAREPEGWWHHFERETTPFEGPSRAEAKQLDLRKSYDQRILAMK